KASFSNLLTSSINSVNELRRNSGDLRRAFEVGDPNVTLPDVMIAKAKAGVAFEGMMQVRNKLVDAYSEVKRMPV
ncbi:MAG: flagellar hook-basal body complex protein FliE, partial [Gammaproteobacteria bacterium]|nr:flagellar hook-basal body complex protein FliE [Gammaproteobacteria bacterium]